MSCHQPRSNNASRIVFETKTPESTKILQEKEDNDGYKTKLLMEGLVTQELVPFRIAIESEFEVGVYSGSAD